MFLIDYIILWSSVILHNLITFDFPTRSDSKHFSSEWAYVIKKTQTKIRFDDFYEGGMKMWVSAWALNDSFT